MEKLVRDYENNQLKNNVPIMAIGDVVIVNYRIEEGSRKRIQEFTGVVIAMHNKNNRGISSTFTVRKTSSGEGVERVFPVHSPFIESIKIQRHSKVRKAKLYYLRALQGKASRLKERYK
jgi:large subunit ribosomal protein L19